MNKLLRAWYIRHKADKKKYSIKEFCIRVNTGRTTLHYWLKDKHSPTYEHLIRLREMLRKG